MKHIAVIAVLAAIIALAYTGNAYFDHLIENKEYRESSFSEFDKRMELYNLSDYMKKELDERDLTQTEIEAVKWLYASMPWSDAADYSLDFYLKNIEVALKARQEMEWGKKIPQREFLHFVLPVRVNNEKLDNFREVYYSELKERIKGLDMNDAALEINHWCHEKATYLPSDSRTSSPMATILTATGRCGEESVLLVAALRCVGIPARQVYTPRWAHTDDNHAWVEAWIDGKWYFMGACEPEPVLNMAWFNAPASRAMLMHTKVFGNYITDEDIISRTNCYTEINMIQNYVDTRRSVVRVEDMQGNSVENADVEFKIYNYAEFYSVTTQKSNKNGEAALTTGLGDLLAWATFADKFGFAKILGDTTVVVLEHTTGEEFSEMVEVNPPAEGNIPVEVTPEQIALNGKRLAYEDSVRMAYEATFYKAQERDLKGLVPQGRECELEQLLMASKGNWREILAFVESADEKRRGEALDMLRSISGKDLRDTPARILRSHLANTSEYDSIITKWNNGGYNDKGEMDRIFYAQYLLSPRIAGENLSEYRCELADCGFSVEKIFQEPVTAVEQYMECYANEPLDAYNPQRIPATPAAVLKVGGADRLSRKIFIIALLRSCGVPARVYQVTGKPQYYKNGWFDIIFPDEQIEANAEEAGMDKGYLKAGYTPTKYLPDPQYYRHFTMAKLENGRASVLNFEEGDATEMGALASWKSILSSGYEVAPGYYLTTSGTRMASGGVLANLQFSDVAADKTSEFRLVMPQNNDKISVLGYIDAEEKFLLEESGEQVSLLSVTGRGYFTVALLGANDEPSDHAVRELEASLPVLNEWNRKLVVLLPDSKGLQHTDKQKLQGAGNLVCYGIDDNGKVAKMLVSACNGEKNALPIIAIADSFGRVVYYSQGYNTSIRTQITDVISKIR